MKVIRIVILLLIVIGVAIQFIRPRLDNPPVTGDLDAPPQVKAILQRACYDCHSNETRLAWFDEPAPAYWLVVNDVNGGRQVLNFSHWDSLNKGQQAGKLFESLNQIAFKTMPLSQYTTFHHGAVVSPGEIETLRQYLLTLAYKPLPDTARARTTDEQYGHWVQSALTGAPRMAVKDEYNGISYQPLAGFPDWQAISTTQRFDNGTLRVIFGNDIAVKAIREGHTNPWPDGATFAKAAWDQLPDSTGVIRTGAFKQVEFMIRDQAKYAATDGWGWARWVGGLGLKPYGNDAGFTSECVNCHRPMAFNDHVFTIPMADTSRLNDEAATLPDSVDGHPLKGKAVTTFVSPQQGTMSTLYGNDLAVKSARSGQQYALGSVIWLVTWSQREDPHWFGGMIPKTLKSVEIVELTGGGEMQWHRYEGPGLAPANGADLAPHILGLKASIVPTP
jgi:hypothetical protein